MTYQVAGCDMSDIYFYIQIYHMQYPIYIRYHLYAT